MPNQVGFYFFSRDWRADSDLQSCSYAAKGLWIDMLGLMSESERRGYLEHGGKPLPAEMLARLTHGSHVVVRRLLVELEAHNVFTRGEADVIFCRRMVAEGKQRAKDGERVRRHREKQRVTPDVTAGVTRSDTASVTALAGKAREGTVRNAVTSNDLTADFDGEAWVGRIANAWVKPESGHAAASYTLDAIAEESGGRHTAMEPAAEFVLSQVQLIRQQVDRWPAPERARYCPGFTNFMAKRLYRQDPELWRREQAGAPAALPVSPSEQVRRNREAK